MRPVTDGTEKIEHEDLAAKWAMWAGVGFLVLFGIFGVSGRLQVHYPGPVLRV